jgi:predicted transcriptional regulator
MEVHFSDELQQKLDELAVETGRDREDFVHDALAGYFSELQQANKMIDDRYDEIRSGKVKLIDGEEAFRSLKAKAELQLRK